MYKAFLLTLIILSISLFVHAEVEINDSANFVRIKKEMLQEDYIKASVLVASSGNAIYSAPGHAALRLECPKHQIDYCYEFDNIVNLTHILDYINGNMQALFKRLYTESFIERYSIEGRGVQSVTLNLTPQQEVDLWQSLDYQVDSVGKRKFDFLTNNCASMVVRELKESIDPERIEYKEISPYFTGTHRQVFPYIFCNAPWAEFCWNILMGTGFDEEYDLETKLFPVSLIDVWTKAVIINIEGKTRPLCSGPTVTILLPQTEDKPSLITPKVLFFVLLVFTLVISIIDYFKGPNIISNIWDFILMTIETVLGVIILYMLLFSNQVATSWNWLFIVFSPIPFILWLIFHKCQKFYNVYPLYAIISLSFCIFKPFIPQMQYGSLPLLLLCFSIRCVFLWLKSLVNINNKLKKQKIMRLRRSSKVVGIMMLMLTSANVARADYGLYGLYDDTDTYYKDCSVKLSSPSSARGVVYVDINGSRKKSNNPYSQTGPAQVSTLKANFSGSYGYYCYLYAYPKAGYVLDGFVQKSDYLANRTSSTYFLKNSSGKIYRSGDEVAFAKVSSSTDPTSDPTSSSTYRFSVKETVECYAIFRTATSQTINVSYPGGVESAVINSSQGIEVDNLIVKGSINATDIKFLCSMIKDHHLVRLDLSGARIDEIPDQAFQGCTSLYEIKLPISGLLRIGNKAFANCRNMKWFSVPSSVSIVADNAFEDCISRNLRFK